jgi:hypothetical protein
MKSKTLYQRKTFRVSPLATARPSGVFVNGVKAINCANLESAQKMADRFNKSAEIRVDRRAFTGRTVQRSTGYPPNVYGAMRAGK